jgi:hypothetical protein
VVKRGNLVTLQAKLSRTSGSGTTPFTIPAGYRPSADYGGNDIAIHTLSYNGGTSEGPLFISVIDSTTGVCTFVQVSNGQTWSTSTIVWVSGSWYTD